MARRISPNRLDVSLCELDPLLAAEQLQQNLNPLSRLHISEDRQVPGKGTAQDPDLSSTP
jgi:hypothetical protein